MTDARTMLAKEIRAEADSVTVPPGLAERITQSAASLPLQVERGSRGGAGWRKWVLPVVAAAATVAVLASAAVVGARLLRSDGSPPAPVLSQGPTPGPTPGPTQGPTPAPTPGPSTPATPPPSASVRPVALPVGFRALDLTWISADEGWALSYPICTAAHCVAIGHTVDGGRSWSAIRTPNFSMLPGAACDPTCVNHLRFASPQVGYAFSEQALFMTTDGGASWQQQPGGAEGLEVANGVVLRLVAQVAGCAPGCTFTLQRAAVGSTQWQRVEVPGLPEAGVSATLARSGPTVAIAIYQHTAGGAQDARSTVFTSADDGHSWFNRGEPCPQRAGSASTNEVDTSMITVAVDRTVALLCSPRAGGAKSVVVSRDAGASFRGQAGRLGEAQVTAFAATSADTLFASSDSLYRSVDGGTSWVKVQRNSAGPGAVSYVGFESGSTGRAISRDPASPIGGRTIWTTRDSGLTWTAFTFS